MAYTAPSNQIRVTYDSDIRCTRANFNLFDDQVSWMPLLEKSYGVLEVKYDGFLFSYIRDALHGIDALPQAFGKYALACRMT